MSIRSLARRLAWAAALALPLAANAQQAFTTHLLNLRAGPAQDFPIVATLPQGAEVMIQGCTSDYAWCDVQTPNALRGWVYAQYLSHPFQGNPVPVNSMGAAIGIPVLTFALGAYWANHYRDRPWYHNQSQWDRPYYPHRPPNRPPPHVRPPHPHQPDFRPPRPDNRPPHMRPQPDNRPPHVRPQPDNRPPHVRPQPDNRPPHAGRPPSGGNRPDHNREGQNRPQRPGHASEGRTGDRF